MDYRGIDKEGLNRMATLDAYSKDEVKMTLNAFWRRAYGHDVIDPIKDDEGRL